MGVGLGVGFGVGGMEAGLDDRGCDGDEAAGFAEEEDEDEEDERAAAFGRGEGRGDEPGAAVLNPLEGGSKGNALIGSGVTPPANA